MSYYGKMKFDDAFVIEDDGEVRLREGLADVNLIVTARYVYKLKSVDPPVLADMKSLLHVYYHVDAHDSYFVHHVHTDEPTKLFTWINGVRYFHVDGERQKVDQLLWFTYFGKGEVTIDGGSRDRYVIGPHTNIEVVPKRNSRN